MRKKINSMNSCCDTGKGKVEISIRTLTDNDLTAAMRLKTIAGWNQTEHDWRTFLAANPEGNYAAICNGHTAGTAATIRYDNRIAWISMVLVDPDYRRMGIGKKLLHAAIDGLNDVPSVKLDATPDGKKLYDTLGFVDESTLQRWVCPTTQLNTARVDEHVRRATPDDFESIIELDVQAFGAKRDMLLRTLLKAAPSAWCFVENDVVKGFVLGREGTNFYHIGPVVAEDLSQARALIEAVLHDLHSRPVLLDVPDMQSELTSWLQTIGFNSQRPLIRMRRGAESGDLQLQKLFAICGPEFG